MHPLRLYRAALAILLTLLGGGLAIWFAVSAPEGTSSDRILRDVTLFGRVDELVRETTAAVRSLAAALGSATEEDLTAPRGQLASIQLAGRRLQQDLEEHRSSWIPVEEASDVLKRSLELCRDTWDRTAAVTAAAAAEKAAPPTAGAAGPKADAPAAAETASAAASEAASPPPLSPAEIAALLTERQKQLLAQAERLRTRVEQAITEGMLARGTFLGWESGQWLLGALILATLVGLIVAVHALRRARLAPERLERMELELVGRSDRRAALQKCHERVRDLLDFAEGLCRGGKM